MNKRLNHFILSFLFCAITAMSAIAQTRVSGRVTDAAGEAIIGANVMEKGTSNGTITDIDGKYSIGITDGGAVLMVSFIGYVAQEIGVNSRSLIDIVLREDAQSIEEVVVVGYGTQKKVNLTGAVTAVKTEDLVGISASKLSNTLAGRAPGVNITGNSGMAGASSEIRMRGGFGEPLFVIDGVVRDKAAFDALDANEVDQLSFLKDAATASIYGSRAGNGVVLVTTKRGEQQKPVFNYQGSYSYSAPTMTLFADRTTAVDELVYQNRVADYQGLSRPNGEREFEYFANNSYNVNDYIWQNPWNQRHLLNVSGGNDRLVYYALVGYRGEEGSYKSLEFNRFNLRSNVTAKITDAVKLGLNVAAYQQNGRRFNWPFSSADADDNYAVEDLYRCTFNWPKLYPLYLEKDGSPSRGVTDFPLQVPVGSWNMWNVVDQVIGNRYIRIQNREVNAILTLDVDLGAFVPGLSTKFSGNYIAGDYMRKKYLTYQKNYSFVPKDPTGNRFIPAAPDPNKYNIFTFSQNQESLTYNINTLWRSQLNWFLNYDRTFDKHGISGMIVWEQGQNGAYEAEARGEAPLSNYDQMFVYSRDPERRYGNAAERVGAYMSWIGRLNYNFDQKYIVEFSFRYDGNTLFPKNKRWGFFPSASAAWRINNESFMSNTSEWLSNLKLRASVGTTGNDLNVNNAAIAQFSYIPTYDVSSSSSYIFGNTLNTGITPGATPNVNLTWATSVTYNGGFDFGILNNRLSGTVDVFYKNEYDVLGSRVVTLPDTYGQGLAPENYAARSWRGGELSLMWHSRVGKLDYAVHGNMGYAKDRWDVLDQSAAFLPGGSREWESAIGQPIDRIIGLKCIGMLRTQEEVDALKAKGFKQYGRDPYLGGLVFEDVRGDGYAPGADNKIDGNDFQVLSTNGKPRINYGFGGNISWKGFALDILFQGVGAYDRIISNQDGPGMRQHGGSVRPYYPIWAGDVWTPENPNAKYPRVIGNSWYESGTGATSFWIRNGAYLRLKSINAAYNLPEKWISCLGLSGVQVFFNGDNIFFLSAMSEFHDPEQKNYDSYPIMKTFTFGLNIQF
jgi:TonB-linked SusC/RagA family outer membrane protein